MKNWRQRYKFRSTSTYPEAQWHSSGKLKGWI